MRGFISIAGCAVLTMVSATAAPAGQQVLRCAAALRGASTPSGNPLPLRFFVTVTNPLKILVSPATPGKKAEFNLNHNIIPPGAKVSVRYGSGSHMKEQPAFRTTDFVVAQSIRPGMKAEFKSAVTWKGDCTARAAW